MQRPLPAALVYYLAAFPIAFGIVGKSFIFADLFIIFLIVSSFVNLLFKKSIGLLDVDSLLVAFCGAALLGRNNLVHPGAFAFEFTSVVFLYVGSRLIADEIAEQSRFTRFLNILGRMFHLFLYFSVVIIFLHMIGVPELTDFFYSVHDNYKGFFNFTNQLAIFLICLAPLAMIDKSESYWLRFISYGALFLVMSSTASRSGFWILIGQVCLIEMFYPQKRSRAQIVLSFATIACIVALVISVMATDEGMQRSLGSLEYAPLSFDKPRIQNFREAFNSSADWVLGYGLGCFDQVHVHEVHNTPFSLLVETGLAGFIFSGLLFLLTAIRFFRVETPEEMPLLKRALCVSWAGIMAIGMFHYLLRNRSCWLVFALTLVLVYYHRPGEQTSD